MTADPYSDAGEQGRSIKEYLAVLRRHLLLMFLVTAASLAITGYLIHREEPRYVASAVIRLTDDRNAIAGGLAERALDPTARVGGDVLLSQIQVLLSRGVAEAVVDSTGLRLTAPERAVPLSLLRGVRVAPTAAPDTLHLRFTPQWMEVRVRDTARRARYNQPVEINGVRFAVAAPPAAETGMLVVVPRDVATTGVLRNLEAKPRERTDVVDVRFTAGDAALAQRVVNAVAVTFQAANAQAAQQRSRRRRIFIEDQLRETDAQLEIAQRSLSGFRSTEEAYSSREKFMAQQSGLLELQVRREELEGNRRVYQSLLDAVQRRGRGGAGALAAAPEIAANPAVAGLYQQLVTYETARDSMVAAGSSPTNPEVQRVAALIASTSTRLVSAVRGYIASLDARVASMREMEGRNASEIRTLPGVEAEEVRLVQRVETTRRMADQLREEHQRARIEEAVEAGQVEIVDFAAQPSAPVGSGRARKLLFGLLIGLALGGGGAFLLENLNTALTRTEEIEALLGVPSLGVIPRIGRGGRRGAAEPAPGDPSAELVAAGDLHSTGAEAFRTLRTNLLFSQSARRLRTLVVTSALPSEGKTTTTANLAVAFAQQGLRVLLVDADLRRARMHRVFGVPREPGLTQLVLGYGTLEAVVRPTGVDGLFILPAGALPPNPSELLGGEEVRKLIASLTESYDMVVFDTPPLLAAADAAVLGTAVDGVMVVVRAGQTEREAAKQAVQQLKTVGARVLGAVLNDPEAKLPRYGGYYYAYGYYGTEDGAAK